MNKRVIRTLTNTALATGISLGTALAGPAAAIEQSTSEGTRPGFDTVEAQLEAGMKAAHQADPKAMHDGVEPGSPGAKAIRLLKPLAQGGCAQAQYALGLLPPWDDLQEQLDRYQQAAEQGHPDAMWHIALEYLVPKDSTDYEHNEFLGILLLTRAAQQGHAKSMLNLAFEHQDGVLGSPSLVQAFKWQALALPRLPPYPSPNSEYTTKPDRHREKLGELAHEMTEEQIQRATQMVVDWEQRNEEIHHVPDHVDSDNVDESFTVWYWRVEGGCNR